MEARGFIPGKFWNFKAWKCNFLQSKDGDLGGLSLENFEISRPENAISCNLGIDFFSAYVQQERPFVDFFSAWKPEICQNQGNSRSFFQNQGNSRKIFKFKEIWGNPSDSRSSGQPVHRSVSGRSCYFCIGPCKVLLHLAPPKYTRGCSKFRRDQAINIGVHVGTH